MLTPLDQMLADNRNAVVSRNNIQDTRMAQGPLKRGTCIECKSFKINGCKRDANKKCGPNTSCFFWVKR